MKWNNPDTAKGCQGLTGSKLEEEDVYWLTNVKLKDMRFTDDIIVFLSH